MANLTIKDLDEGLMAKLRARAARAARAARNGRSVDAEALAILRAALAGPASGKGIGSLIRERFKDVDHPSSLLPPRTDLPRAAELPE